MNGRIPELLVVMPVFNEQASVETVVREWIAMLGSVTPGFRILAIDDGSTDNTARILGDLQNEFGEQLEWLRRPNRGHGQTCVEGYRVALDRRIPFVFQIDSDGQSDPRYFAEFWTRRNDFDVIYGKRTRQDGLRRIAASLILRSALLMFARVDCVDANVPYRLMNAKACASAIHAIPDDIFLANVALAVALRKSTTVRHGFVPIGFPARHGGEPSVPFLKFASKGIELFAQLKKAGII
jgi:dolichol-phosphate mannosyltransferase